MTGGRLTGRRAGLRDPSAGREEAQRPSVLAARHGLDLLVGHFALGRPPAVVPEGWSGWSLDGWTLVHEPSLPVHELRDARGDQVGWVLGHALDVDAAELRTAFDVPADASTPGFAERLEEWLYDHGGRWAAVVLRPRPRLYLDVYGSLPALFDPARELVASSPFLLREPGDIRDGALVDEFRVLRQDGDLSFVLGTTPVEGVERLTPNHALDLAAWAPERIWPRGPVEAARDPAALVERIGRTLDGAIAALAMLEPNVSLTGGGDTRLMLACARDHVDRLSFFTVALPDALGSVDVRTAPRIAERFGLDHRLLPWREPSAADVERFVYRTGCMVGERRGRLAGPTYEQLGGGRPYVSGISTFSLYPSELRWRRRDSATMEVTAEGLVERFRLPRHPELVRRAEAWLAELPPMDALRTLALFTEELTCYWAGGLTTAFPDAYSFTAYPSAHRRIQDAALALEWRDRLPSIRQALVRERWPELLEIPINPQTLPALLRRRARRSYHLARGATRRVVRALTA